MIPDIKYKLGRLALFLLCLAVVLFGAATPTSTAAEGELTDYDQQALYTVKLGKSYVEWPTATSTSDGVKIINICVLGENENFTKSLNKFEAALVGKLKMNISNIEDGQSFNNCNILYIPKNRANFKTVLNNVKTMPVLTLSPISGFANNGGIVELSVKEVDQSGAPMNSKATVNLIINNKAAMSVNIKIAPELLESAAEVIR